MKFEGIYTPLITPYGDDFAIDYNGLGNIIEHLIESGVTGVISGGTTGEYYSQSDKERIALMRFVNQQVKGRVRVMAGVGALRTEEAEQFAEQAKAIGVDAILVNAPSYVLPTQLELAEHALAIDRAANLPIMLYNYPGRTGTMMGAEFLDRVSDSTNFAAIKESSGDINQLHMLAQEYPQLQLSCGMDDQALEFFAWGATSWVAAGANCLAREHVALYQACAINNDFATGRRIMSAMMPFLQVLEQGGKFTQSVKYGCELSGLTGGRVRKPLLELNEDDKRQVERVIDTMRTRVAQITDQQLQEGTSAVAV
ncbi:MAG: dihydrodipicolinate synthase family protein [Gammaproteobacteria bacterium]|nr:dihydrodipicolinate synthase family protein [Gammaproteobacteria bacterium]